MRVVVFTARQDLTETAFWTVLTRMPGVSAILLCEQQRTNSSRTLLRRFWANLRRHGLLYVPYRMWHALKGTVGGERARLRLWRREREDPPPLTVLQVRDLNSSQAVERIRSWEPDLGVSIGAPILRRELFSLPRRGSINIHGGKVPDFRGAPPGFWELYTGADEIGATLHEMTERLDAGDVLHSAVAPIYPDDSLESVRARAEELSVRVFERGLAKLIAGETKATPQPNGQKPFRFPDVRTRLELDTRLRLRRLWRHLRDARTAAKSVVYWCLLYLYRPLRDAFRTATGTHAVRVFTFHRVTHLCRDGMTAGPDQFRQQVEFLDRTHRVVPLREAVELVRSGARLRRPVASITFDDGYRSVLDIAYPILEAHGMTATCFLCTGLVDTPRRFEHDCGSSVEEFMDVMGWDEVHELSGAGWTVGAHTIDHPRLSAIHGPQLRLQLEEPLEELRRRLGLEWVALAYPFGQASDISAEAVRMAQDVGYDAAFQDYGGEARGDEPVFRLPRIELGGHYPKLVWKARAHGIRLRRSLS